MNHSSTTARRLLAATLLSITTSAYAQSAPGVTEREIVLGQSASFSGSFASQATSYRDGALAYFNAVNAKGGLNGRKIRLVSLDDGYVVDRATANTLKLINDEKVFALFNYTWTNTVKASIPLAEKAGVPMLGPYTGYQELYAKHSPLVFTTRASFADELAQIIKHLRTIGLTRIGLVHYDSLSGKELLAEAQQHMQAAQLKLHGVASMKAGSKDPSGAVKLLGDSDMQALIIGASGSDAVAFIREFEKVRNGRTQYYARSLIGIKQLVDELGPQSKGVSVSQTAPNPYKSRTSVAIEYRQLLEQLDPKLKPDYIGLEGMISAKVMVEALKRAGTQPTREALLASLQRMNEYDVGGYHLRFAPNNHHGSRYVDITWIGGEGRVVD